jgi:hypothetical protein
VERVLVRFKRGILARFLVRLPVQFLMLHTTVVRGIAARAMLGRILVADGTVFFGRHVCCVNEMNTIMEGYRLL